MCRVELDDDRRALFGAVVHQHVDLVAAQVHQLVELLLIQPRRGPRDLIQQVFDRGFGAKVDAVVPVPLHALRQWKRGYNQSALLAAPVAVALGKPCLEYALKRKRQTLRQSELSAAQRKANVEGAFELRTGMADKIEGKTLLLVDDVMTTGATLAQAARELKKGGAKAVFAGVIARSMVGSDQL